MVGTASESLSQYLQSVIQVSVAPPIFLLFVNNVKIVTGSFSGFIEREIRERYNFYGTPIRIIYRRKK